MGAGRKYVKKLGKKRCPSSLCAAKPPHARKQQRQQVSGQSIERFKRLAVANTQTYIDFYIYLAALRAPSAARLDLLRMCVDSPTLFVLHHHHQQLLRSVAYFIRFKNLSYPVSHH